MKKIFYIAAAAAALVLAGCQKENGGKAVVDCEKTLVTLHLEGGATKATGISAANEAKFSSVQFFVFDEAGKIEDYKAETGKSTTSLSALAGTKTFVAVLNAKDDLSDAETLTQLNAKVTYLKDNALDHFVMVGTKSQAISGATTDVTLNVHRQVAKIQINKITTAFESAALKAASFSVDRFYIINAAGDCKIGGTGTPSLWYNEAGYHNGTASPLDAADALIVDNVTVDLTGNQSNSTPHVFYVYPNNFAAHNTVLEIGVKINGSADYYCIDFSAKGVTAIEANKTYTVNELVIKHRGNDHDGDGVIDGSASFDCTISIDDWDTGLAPYTETL